MEKKYKIVFVILILMALLSAGKVAADLVTQASNISLSSDKTSKTKVSEALDELYDNIGKCPDGRACLIINNSGEKCQRATTLHEEICSNDSDGCNNTVGNGNTITYGSLGTSGNFVAGNAFNCDVNGDGYLDEEKERFYYVSDLWEGETNTFDSNYAVLIYYTNIIIEDNNVTQNNETGKAYHSSNYNYKGPDEIFLSHIPSVIQWNKVSLKSQTRQIYNETGGTTTHNGSKTLPSYIYENKAARLLTAQEINRACNITTGNYNIGELDTCSYLIENTYYSNSSNNNIDGYWLETPRSSNSSNIWCVYGNNRYIAGISANVKNNCGVRPVIEVLKSDILY